MFFSRRTNPQRTTSLDELSESRFLQQTMGTSDSLQLPERGANPNGSRKERTDPHLVERFSLIHHSASGDLVVAADRKIDPALGDWLERHCGVASQIPDEVERLDYLQNAVRQTFKYTDHRYLHPKRHKIFQSLLEQEKSEATLLGDFIVNGTALCRHGGVLLQLACQMTGLTSIIRYGTSTPLDPVTGKKDGEPHGHVWNIVATRSPLGVDGTLGGTRIHVVDFAQGHGEIERWGSPMTHEDLLSLYGRDKKRIVAKFGSSQHQLLHTTQSALTFVRVSTDSYSQGVIKFAFEHSLQAKG